MRRRDSDLVIMATPEGCIVRRRPLPVTGLRLADYEAPMENPPRPYPFGPESAGSAYQNAVHHLIADHLERNRVTDPYVIDSTDSGQLASWSTWWPFVTSQRIPLFRPNLFTTSWAKAPMILPRA